MTPAVRSRRTGAALVALYLALALTALALALLGPRPPGRGFWVETGVALGFVGLAMMGIQFALTARFAFISSRLGQDTLLQFHKYAGLAAAAFVFSHPIVLIAARPEYAAFFDPRVNPLRALALSASLVALAALLVLALGRIRLRVPYEWWRATHGALAAFIILVALAHGLMVGWYISTPMKQAAYVALIAVPLALIVHVRLLRPCLARRRPYTVAEVRRELDGVWTVALEPVAHESFRFEAGQFAWITFGDSPYGLRQHPFTIASSAERPGRLEFTIKEFGDFTRTIGLIPLGSTAFVEGPAGNFVLPRDAHGAVLIAGGIGITPMISILRTMRDRRDRRPVMLIYGNPTLDRAVFRDEIDSLRAELDLRIVHVPEYPPDGWTGPSGYVTKAVCAACCAGPAFRDHQYLICGPDAMMDAVEAALLELGVPRHRIRSERFTIV